MPDVSWKMHLVPSVTSDRTPSHKFNKNSKKHVGNKKLSKKLIPTMNNNTTDAAPEPTATPQTAKTVSPYYH